MPATPEKVEEKWNVMNLALKSGILNWEHGGQGDGGYTEDDDSDIDRYIVDDDDEEADNMNNLGLLQGLPQQALDLHCIFLGDKVTYLLHLWDVLHKHNLVQSSMQQLLDGICSGNGGSCVLSVIGGKHKSDADDLHASSKKSKNNTADHGIVQLSSSIERCSQSLAPAAEISAREQKKKNCKQQAASEEKSCTQQLKSEISARINLLHDKKQNMNFG